MNTIYKFLKRNKNLEVKLEKFGNNIIEIRCNPKGKTLIDNFGVIFPSATIRFEEGKIHLIWGTVMLEFNYAGEDNFEDCGDVIKKLVEKFKTL
jgi:hypothetical protein